MIVLLLAACQAPAPTTPLPEGVDAEPPPGCAAPVSGFTRLQEEGAARGLHVQNPDTDEARACPTIPGGVVASDLDGDGDPDLAMNNPLGFPWIYENQGGQFTERSPGSGAPTTRRVEAVGALDLDDDGLPELLAVGEGFAAVARNEGALQFSAWELLFFQDEYPHTCLVTAAWGDLDADGDVDIALPGADPVPYAGHVMIDDPDALVGDLTRVLRADDGAYTVLELARGGNQGLALYAGVVDLARDGAPELLIGADRPVGDMPPMAVYQLDGDGQALDLAPLIGFALPIAAMGAGVGDLNADGLPDLIFSDLGPKLAAVESDGRGGYFEAGAALGFNAPHAAHPDFGAVPNPDQAIQEWTTWSVELDDLDNDGLDDLAVVSGQLPNEGNPLRSWITDFQPDALYQGRPGGLWLERAARGDFARADNRYGMAAADFDGDGYRDLVIGPYEGPPLFWSNPCGEEAWTELRLIGPPENPEAWGATLVVGAEGRLRSVQGLRTVGQSSPEVHVGLGAAEVFDLRIEWPDGTYTELDALPTRRRLTVRHPEATR